MSNNNLTVTNLSFAFNQKDPLFFHNLSFTCQVGTITFLQGKNGVGKSTLFRLLQGHIRPYEIVKGSFSINNTAHAIANNQMPASLSTTVKMVVQNINSMLAPDCNAIQNLQLAQIGTFPTLAPLPEITDLSILLSSKDIPLTTPAHLLSGGQRQLLAIEMALQTPTSILLLDEPTAALDERNTHLVIQTVAHAAKKRGLVVLVVTHDTELVNHYKEFPLLLLHEKDGKKTIEYSR
jgi:ABC-type lipoprotein export system ATPase subunit